MKLAFDSNVAFLLSQEVVAFMGGTERDREKSRQSRRTGRESDFWAHPTLRATAKKEQNIVHEKETLPQREPETGAW